MDPRFLLTESTIKKLNIASLPLLAVIKGLNRVAVSQGSATPGEYRTVQVRITNAPHVPPPWMEVAESMAKLCEYINAHWQNRDSIHLSSFVLWRLCWIHPFQEGNGRTSRAAAYLILKERHGQMLPAESAILGRIVSSRKSYYEALRLADHVFGQSNNIDLALQSVEALLAHILNEQLL